MPLLVILGLFLCVLVLLPLVWLGWSVIATTIAHGLVDIDPESALTWQPGDSTALVALADRQLQAAVGSAWSRKMCV